MGPSGVGVDKVGTEHAAEMVVVVYDDVILALPPNRADQSFDVGILPGSARGRGHIVDPERLDPSARRQPIHAVSVPQEIAWGVAPRKSLDDLLAGPLARGVLGDMEMNHPAPLKAQHNEHVENPKRHRRDSEQVDASETGSLISEERLSDLIRWSSTTNHELGHRCLRNPDSQHRQFPMHARCAPAGVVL